MIGETVTRLRAAATSNRYSGTATSRLDWTDPDRLDIEHVAVEPGASSESQLPEGERLDVAFTLYGPFGSDVEPLDRVEVRGTAYDVIGARRDWRNPYTDHEAGCVIEVRRVAGA